MRKAKKEYQVVVGGSDWITIKADNPRAAAGQVIASFRRNHTINSWTMNNVGHSNGQHDTWKGEVYMDGKSHRLLVRRVVAVNPPEFNTVVASYPSHMGKSRQPKESFVLPENYNKQAHADAYRQANNVFGCSDDRDRS